MTSSEFDMVFLMHETLRSSQADKPVVLAEMEGDDLNFVTHHILSTVLSSTAGKNYTP